MGEVKYVEFKSDNGLIRVEAEEMWVSGPAPASVRGAGVPAERPRSFEEAIEGIEPIAQAVIKKVERLKVSQATVEFGVKLTAAAGVVLASAGGEAHLKLTLTWTPKSDA